ncbi:uncharacterized protein LOC121528577 [Cheilinus undulatus]|uniref:uncharacterized protein LOC121528577 n=1 Tax=Cheilinus undulatus TaxID=241271 RepID=UPI001BD6084F|nr:uncharacterized protein LOC121528577 [Cheilinus undulatus]
MEAHWWSCVLGLLCMPARVLGSSTVSQQPLYIPLIGVNSSTEILCSTPLLGAQGFSLHGHFRGNKEIVYLHFDDGVVTKKTIAPEYESRIHVTPAQKVGQGQGFLLQFSLLGVEDIDVYLCSWSYLIPRSGIQQTLTDKGTFIFLREKDPQEECKRHILERSFIILSVIALILLFVFIGALIVRCNRFRSNFTPVRAEATDRPRPLPVPPQQTSHCHPHPYLITSLDSLEDGSIRYA